MQPTSTEDISDKPQVDDLTYFLETQRPPDLYGDENNFMKYIIESAQIIQEIRNTKRDMKGIRHKNLQAFRDFRDTKEMLKENLGLCKSDMNDAYDKIKNVMSLQLINYLNDTKYIEKPNKKGEIIKGLSWMGRFLGKKIPQTQDELLRRNNQLEQQLTNYNKLRASQATASQPQANQAKGNKTNGRYRKGNFNRLNYHFKKGVGTREMFEGGDYDAPPEFLGADFHPDAPYLNDDDLY